MPDIKTKDLQAFALSNFDTASLLEIPSKPDEHCDLKICASVLDLKATNANPGITQLEAVNAMALLSETVSLGDIQKMDALAAHLGLTQSQLLRRWSRVLLYFMGYIDNPAPLE